ncbi:SDR family NAD(P)-dependent oxidoreductase [Micromonospora sp. NPDC005161]
MTRRRALVTGASRGIGFGIASYLAEQGFDLVISARPSDSLEAAAKSLRGLGAEVTVAPADMGDRDEVLQLTETVQDQWSELDVLVLAAGVGTAHGIVDYPARRLDKQLNVNFGAPFLLLSHCLPLLREGARQNPTRGAKVIALSSIGGVYPEAGLSAYGASKAALSSLCQSVNLEEATHGVTATAIAPAYVDTEMSAWIRDTIPQDEMISVDDIVSIVGSLITLSRRAVVPQLVVHRASDNLYKA